MRTALTAVSALALLAMATPTIAADVYQHQSLKDAAPYVEPAPSWTGFYIGLGAQGDFASHAITLGEGGTDFAKLDGLSGQDIGFVATVGADWQMGKVVAGIGFDYDLTSATTTSLSSPAGYFNTLTYGLTDYWTAFGRVGVLVTPSALVYGKAGYGQATFHPTGFPSGSGVGDHTFDGLVVGGGIEVRTDSIIKGTSFRLEYTDFLANQAGQTWVGCEGECNATLKDDLNIQSVKAIVAIKFGGDYPVSLK